jgi:MFS transporter, DHA2 family, multidrug resistance protein
VTGVDRQSNPHKWLVTLTVMTGSLMAALDMSITNVALPHIRGSLGASVEEIAWVATGYMLSNVITMPAIALLSSRFGRKRFYLFSVALFTCASVLCGVAWDLSSMIAFRALQGIGGGALLPLAQAILRETFPPKEQATAMGIYGLGIILGPAFAPTLGGWITDNYSWPWIFYINIPVGILNILLIMRFIQDPPYLVREKGKLDYGGLLFMAVGLGALQIMLEKGDQKDWFDSHLIVYLAVAAFLGLLFFTIRELTTDEPAVNLRILRDINFSSGTFLSSILSVGLFSSLFILPLFLQQLLGYSALQSGIAVMPRSIGMAIVMPTMGRVYNRVGPKVLIAVGLFINAFSFYQFSRLSLVAGYWDIFIPQGLQGIGSGLIFVSLSTAVLSTIEKPLMTAASGLYNVIRQMFGSVGIALAATFLTRGEVFYHAFLAEHVTAFRDIATDTLQQVSALLATQGVNASDTGAEALKLVDGLVTRQATMLAYNYVYLLIALVYLLAIPFVLLVRDAQQAVGPKIVAD